MILRATKFFSSAKLLSSGIFSHVPMAPPDPILGTAVAYKNDPSGDKVNLGIGAYRCQKGNPYVFKVVREVQQHLTNSNLNKEYIPIEGTPQFRIGARNLIFGQDSIPVKQGRVVTTQALSGTGALYIAMDFIRQYMPRNVYIPNPTWLNHKNIIQDCNLKWIQYPYYNPETKGSNIAGMLKCLQGATTGSVVLLHACAHNPTGVDPTQAQWKQIAEVMQRRQLIPFFDSAYQGFATGDLINDAWPIRYFTQKGFQLFLSQSFAKNMGLYGQRIGALHVIVENKDLAEKVLSQIKIIIRKKYSSPPLHGALLAGTILNNKAHFESWRNQLKNTVAIRIIEMRNRLREQLERIHTPGSWNHITDQIGMFSYTGLSVKQCEILINKYHIYLLKSGRISMAGVNQGNVKYIAQSIKAAIQQAP